VRAVEIAGLDSFGYGMCIGERGDGLLCAVVTGKGLKFRLRNWGSSE